MTTRSAGDAGPPSAPHPLIGEAMGQVRAGNPVKATATLDSAALMMPDDPRVDLARVRVCAARQDHIGVLAAAERVLIAIPGHPESLFHRAHALYLLGRLDRALEAVREIDASGHARLQHNLCAVEVKCLLRRGRIADARRGLERLAAFEGDTARIGLLRIEAARRSGEHEEVERRCQALLGRGDLVPADRVAVGFEWARLLDRVGRYDEAAKAASVANQAGAPSFDPRAFEEKASETMAYFTAERLAGLPRPAGGFSEDDRPVFIVGMPRSGTSLLEQIVSAHPEADGVGERREPFLIDEDLAARLGRPSPGWLAAAPPELLGTASKRYADMLRIMETRGRRVTNKALGLETLVGFLAVVFPRARFLWIRRAASDNRLSIWLHWIQLPWAWRLPDIDAARRVHDRLHDHWMSVLPDRIHSIRYEQLVDDQAGETKRLLDFLGLGPAETCLDFHLSERAVMTPSSEQVRRPLNRDAIGRGAGYGKILSMLDLPKRD